VDRLDSGDERARYDELVEEFVGRDGVAPPRGGSGFGRNALRVDGRIFAMFVRGTLVVKLPADRVRQLIDAGFGDPFDANKGTPMREWVGLDPTADLDWVTMADEALTFVREAGRGDDRRA
jgi:hypothetical protein